MVWYTQWPLIAQVRFIAQGAQLQAATHTPPSHTSAMPHITPWHGSTQRPRRHT